MGWKGRERRLDELRGGGDGRGGRVRVAPLRNPRDPRATTRARDGDRAARDDGGSEHDDRHRHERREGR